jgi:hypothetical protein
MIITRFQHNQIREIFENIILFKHFEFFKNMKSSLFFENIFLKLYEKM